MLGWWVWWVLVYDHYMYQWKIYSTVAPSCGQNMQTDSDIYGIVLDHKHCIYLRKPLQILGGMKASIFNVQI